MLIQFISTIIYLLKLVPKIFKLSSILLITACLTISLQACKSGKKNTLIKRAYHNTTAHYNGYFNAKMRIDNFAKQSEKAYVDRYDQLLSVFRHDTEKKPGSGTQALDEAIKKASYVIQRHEISRWIDDSYLLIGQAYFYKSDYYTALESFQFVAGKYKGKPIANEAYTWMIRSYVQLGKLAQAESIINVALASTNFPKKGLSDLFASTASFYIVKKNYPKAIEYLQKSINHENKKSTRARYTYIIAQLYEHIGEADKAAVHYRKVMKMRPPYEMEFNAKINSARLFQAKTLASKKEIQKQLHKLLRDDKNIEFRDQIYFALADIEEKENDIPDAMRYYRLSSQSSINNFPQKGNSLLRLATIYFDQTNYEQAQLHYDSASTFLPKEHAQYELALSRKNSLARLVENLKIIAREDSLQNLAKMSDEDRLKAIDQAIAYDKEAERKAKEAEENLKNNLANASTLINKANTPTVQGNIWYFYNPAAMGIGANDFVKQFGRRALEDNWRRSNKESFASIEEEENDAELDSIVSSGKNETDALRIKYSKNIPLTESQMKASLDKIAKAYYNAGLFYKEELNNLKASITTFEALIRKYPENNYLLESYFNLYRIYLSQNNISQSDYYKNKLLNDYPESLFTKVILDPDYSSDVKELDKRAQKYYSTIYDAYLTNNYPLIIGQKSYVDSTFANTSIGPLYAYLYALSIAKTESADKFESALQDLIKNYPGSTQADLARETLKKIAERKNKGSISSNSIAEVKYETDARGPFYYMISVNMKSNLNATKAGLAQLNRQQFSLDKLNIISEILDDSYQYILVREFNDLNKARNYLSTVNKEASTLIKIPPADYSTSIISQRNFITLKESKELKKYLQFYQLNYSTNE